MDVATQNHLHMLRDALLYRLGALRADVHAAQLAHGQGRGTPEALDNKDLAERQQFFELMEVQERRDLEELEATQAALERLDAGNYGDCADCGEPIGLPRLQLMPAAPRCAACQQRNERERK
jgi:DnaK suppressor protein